MPASALLTRRTLLKAAGVVALTPGIALAQPKPGEPPSVISTPPRDFGPNAPPNVYFTDPDVLTVDPAFNLDVVTGPRPWEPGVALSNSFAFGGHNGTLVFAPPC